MKVNSSNSCKNISLKTRNCDINVYVRGKVKGSPKSIGFILWGTWTLKPLGMSIKSLNCQHALYSLKNIYSRNMLWNNSLINKWMKMCAVYKSTELQGSIQFLTAERFTLPHRIPLRYLMQIQTQNDNDGKNYKWETFPAGLHRLMDNVFIQRLSWHDFLDCLTFPPLISSIKTAWSLLEGEGKWNYEALIRIL